MKYGAGLFIISVMISIVLLSPSVKKWTMGVLMGGNKTILSQIEMEEQGTRYKIVKVKTPGGLAIELYKMVEGELMLLDTQGLTDKKDAYYKFDNGKYNLFIKDINNDGQKDIILPTLDKNLKARLNIFNLDTFQEKLVKRSEH